MIVSRMSWDDHSKPRIMSLSSKRMTRRAETAGAAAMQSASSLGIKEFRLDQFSVKCLMEFSTALDHDLKNHDPPPLQYS